MAGMADDMDQREDLLGRGQQQPSTYLSQQRQPPAAAQQQLQQWMSGSSTGAVRGMTASASFPVLPSGAGSGCFSGEAVAAASAPCSPAAAAFSPAVPSRTRAPVTSISPMSKAMQAKRAKGHRRAASDTTSLRDVNFAHFVKTETELFSLDNDQQGTFRSLQPTAEEKPHEVAMAGPSGSGRHSPPLCSTGEVDIIDEVNELLSFGSQMAPTRKPAANSSGLSVGELAHIDPKRAKRILANRQSAARSKERKLLYITELEGKVIKLKGELNSLRREYKKLHSETDRMSTENQTLEQELASLEDSKSRQDAAYHSLAGQLSDLEVMGMQGFPVQQPRAMQHMIQQPQQQQHPPQQSQQQQQQQQLLWSGNQSALAMPTQAIPVAPVGGGITIQLPNGSQIQIPQGSVVRTADGTLLISGGSQEGVSSPLPLHGLSAMGTAGQERHVCASGSQQRAPGLVASASNSSLADVTSRTVNRPVSPVALQGATLSPEGAPIAFQQGRFWTCGGSGSSEARAGQQDEQAGGAASLVATSGGNSASTVGALSGQGSLREGLLRLSSVDVFSGGALDGLDMDDSWLRSLQEKSVTDGTGNMMD